MNPASRSLRQRAALGAVALATLLTLAPASARAIDAKSVGIGAACAVSNLVYGPAKLIYALFGTITAGIGYAVTAGDTEVARTIFDTSVNGDYVVEPAHLRGEKSLEFVGTVGSGTASHDDWSSAQNDSGF